MNLLDKMTSVIWLERMTLALETIAKNQTELLNIAKLNMPPAKATPKPTEFGVATTEELNKKWREEHPEYDAQEQS